MAQSPGAATVAGTQEGLGSGGTDQLGHAAPLIVHALGLLVLVAGVAFLRDTHIGADPLSALQAIAGQLPITLPAALLVLGAMGLNVTAGAIAIRWLSGEPYRGLAEVALAGLAGAIVIDLLLMAALGAIGFFAWPLLLAAQLAIVGAGLRVRPFLAGPPRLSLPGWWPVGLVLLIAIWAGPIAVQLASPVVPFMDVLPNHVSPAEHLRTFGALASLDVIPSPIYGSSRVFLGYQALAGYSSALAGVPAATAVAALALPVTLLVAAGGWGLAAAVGGVRAAPWALLLIPLTLTFLRLPDARAAVLAFPLLALVLLLLIRPLGSTGRRRAAVLALAVAAAIYVHPVQGALAAGVIGLAVVLAPQRHASTGITAVVGAAILALPQLATTAGLTLPTWSLLLAFAAAAVAVMGLTDGRITAAFDRQVDRLPQAWPRRAGLIGVVGLAAAALAATVVRPELVPRLVEESLATVATSPVLVTAVVLATPLAWRRRGYRLLWLAPGIALIASLVPAFLPIPSDTAAFIGYEMSKTANYFAWPPLAAAGAVGLASLWHHARLPVGLRTVAVGLVVIAAAAPLRGDEVDAVGLTEHRWSESMSISLRYAERGYWQGYPDSRTIVDGPRRELLDALRREIEAGRLTNRTQVLQVARSFQQWVATPLGVFAGVVHTSASLDPEHSFHTEGGRLHHLDELGRLLAQPFGYVILEPDGLPARIRLDIVAAGYEPVYVNAQGEIFMRTADPG